MADARTLVSGPVREEYVLTTRIPGVGVRTRRFLDGLVAEDVLVNQTRAYLYALALRRTYDRDETPRAVRLELTRSRIIP